MIKLETLITVCCICTMVVSAIGFCLTFSLIGRASKSIKREIQRRD